jgi:hypothetical protein
VTNPWAALAARPHLQLIDAVIPEDGRYYHRLRTIVLRRGMSIVEQRATLWHELVHADRGDEQCCEKTERLYIDKQAARLAIDVTSLAEALLWSDDPSEQADQLKTTEQLLAVRLQYLHPSERGYLQRRIAMKESPA